MNYESIIKEISEEVEPYARRGELATYIPELAKVDPDKFGMYLLCIDGSAFAFGDAEEKFSVQSISKVFTLTMAVRLIGDDLWERVDVEPSGDPFNSLVQLEYENGRPRNPLINPGALVVADVLLSHLDEPKRALLDFVRKISGVPDIDFNPKVARSEKLTGFRNAALANLLKAFGNIHNEVTDVLDFYFHQCSLEMNCRELARAFQFYANHGCLIDSGEQILPEMKVKRINAIMQTCGFYDEAGEFAFRVGLPGKSGVGGGIVGIHPQHYSVAVWSPRLNEKGNSVQGMKALELLTSKTGHSIF
ncbi:MAG: glutaminase [Saprospiraceae bacterium]|nr:glutaminase [Saprospiraceae bacterium]